MSLIFKSKNSKKRVIVFLLSMVIFPFNMLSCKGLKTSKKIETNKMSTAVLEYEFKAKLGEGALWNYKTSELYWIDIEGKYFYIYNPITKQNTSYKMPSRIGTVVPYTKSEVIVALQDGIYKFNIVNRKLTLFSNIESTLTENRFNDGKCDPAGNFWVGSMHMNNTELATGNLYRITKEGTADKKLSDVKISNGIVWSKDEKTMYYIDTPKGNISAFNYDIENGTISNERVVVTIPESIGYPDGMAIDEEGMLWVGLWNGNAVGRFNPNTGQLISKIKVPAHNVTACAFGGENLETLYITTARVDMTEKELEEKPLSGSLFAINPGVKGVKSVFFGD